MSDYTAPPTRADLFAWLRQSDPLNPDQVATWNGDLIAEVVSSGSEDVYDMALAIAVELQTEACDVDPYTVGLHGACLRRAARWLAMQGHGLGTMSSADMQTFIPQWDAGIEEGERGKRLARLA